MHREHLGLLCCPLCGGDLKLLTQEESQASRVDNGSLICQRCSREFAILNGIPRFVPRENYASGFGLEWTHHAKTQYDSHTGVPLSNNRFFKETKWPKSLQGELILEVGSGSGRFTEQAANTGATVVSLDYSYAVEANHASNGSRPNVLIVQGDVYSMPFRSHSFDRLFCFGMLQHTPDPKGAFMALLRHLKPGGYLSIDIYKKTFFSYWLATKYWIRPITRRISPERLYRIVKRYVDIMWPIASLLRRIPRFGSSVNWRLLVADYSRVGLRGRILKEWAYLDTFDMLAPRFDSPQTLGEVRAWFREAGLQSVDVQFGFNGIEGTARTA